MACNCNFSTQETEAGLLAASSGSELDQRPDLAAVSKRGVCARVMCIPEYASERKRKRK